MHRTSGSCGQESQRLHTDHSTRAEDCEVSLATGQQACLAERVQLYKAFSQTQATVGPGWIGA